MPSLETLSSRATSLSSVILAAILLTTTACGEPAGGSSQDSADALPSGDITTIPVADAASDSLAGSDADAGTPAEPDAQDADGQGGDGLGELCTSTADCTGDLTCVFPDPGAPSGVCTTGCAEDADCPGGWRCYTLTDSGSDADRQCLPEDLCIDADGDLYGWGGGCRGRDCDDTTALINPAADELCNGLDDDCDERIDDNAIEERTVCDTGFVGSCASGRNTCINGVLTCQADGPLTEETCDTADNDCDGLVDEGDICEGVPCCYGDTCLGVCAAATTTPDGECAPPEGFGDEVCDDLDNDCDGLVDEGIPTVGDACDAAALGVCGTGTLICADSLIVCRTGASSAEVCDELDNDCDGETDEDATCGGEPCCFGDDCDGVCGDARIDESGACVAPSTFGEEVCDGLDNDCDSEVDETFPENRTACATGSPGVCFSGTTTCTAGALECVPDIAASAETCDGLDNDCDGAGDEDGVCVGEPCCFGDDCDGVCGLARVGAGGVCAEPALFGDDLCDGLDNDCDGTLDEADTRSGAGCDTGLPGVCAAGSGVCELGRYRCVAAVASSAEVCDGLDNDCDGTVDDGVRTTFYRDVDGDGFGAAASGTVEACSAPAGFVANNTDCRDDAVSIFPGAAEVSGDGVDQNCDGQEVCFVDADNDGFRIDTTTVSADADCADPGEAPSTDPGGDCNDANEQIYPGRAELCNGVDDNCGGGADEGGVCAGEPCCFTGTCTGVCGTARLGGDGLCAAPATWGAEICDGLDNDCDGGLDEADPAIGVACGTGLPGLCSVGTRACAGGRLVCNATVSPVAEVCDGLDNDCDSTVDEGVRTTWYRDGDSDTFGAAASGTSEACSAPVGFVGNNLDCNDAVNAIRPGVSELPGDEVDQNCDGVELCFVDADNDNYRTDGTVSSSNLSCGDSGEARGSEPANDCNDSNASINPGRAEVCNGVDDNCNGSIDEGVLTTFFRDADSDGFGSATGGTTQACSAPAGFSSSNNDCDDANASVNPGRSEVCNGIDDNCDTLVDNGAPATGGSDADCDNADDDCDGSIDEDFVPTAGACCVGCFGCGRDGCGNGVYQEFQTEFRCAAGRLVCAPRAGQSCNINAECF